MMDVATRLHLALTFAAHVGLPDDLDPFEATEIAEVFAWLVRRCRAAAAGALRLRVPGDRAEGADAHTTAEARLYAAQLRSVEILEAERTTLGVAYRDLACALELLAAAYDAARPSGPTTIAFPDG